MAGRPRMGGVKRDATTGRSRGAPINVELMRRNKAIIASATAHKKVPCSVYMIVAKPFMWPTKVGIAKNVKSRCADLQVGSHQELEIIHAVICEDEVAARKIETKVLNAMVDKGWHVRGEWVEGGSDMILEMVISYAKELGIVWALDMAYEMR